MKNKYQLSKKDLDDTVELLKKMVEIPTVSPSGEHYEDFIRFTDSELKKRVQGIKTDVLKIPDCAYRKFPDFHSQFVEDRFILIGYLPSPDKPKIYLNGHYDVVEPGNLEQWTISQPFCPKIVDGKLYGRGACDMKGSLSSFFKALEIIKREKRELQYDIAFALTPDEEKGTYSGLRYMVDQTKHGNKLIEGDFFYSLDGTQNEISIAKAGTFLFEIDIKGIAVHSCRSFTGINAIHLANYFINELIELKCEVEKRSSRIPANPDLPLGYARPNLSVTYIQGGYSASSIPDRCIIQGTRTVLPDESGIGGQSMVDAQNELVNAILIIKQRYQIECDFKVDMLMPPMSTPEDNPYVKKVREVASEIEGDLFPIACSMGSNDIAWVKQELSLPTFSRGVQREGCNVHGVNENVPIENLKIGVVDLVDFLSK